MRGVSSENGTLEQLHCIMMHTSALKPIAGLNLKYLAINWLPKRRYLQLGPALGFAGLRQSRLPLRTDQHPIAASLQEFQLDSIEVPVESTQRTAVRLAEQGRLQRYFCARVAIQ